MGVNIELVGDIQIISLDNPPVNAFSHATRTDLDAALKAVAVESRVKAVILRGQGRCFSAGGDIRELGSPAASAGPGLSSHIHAAIEACPIPVIALLHGFALGGGLETALACHYRVAQAATQLALPEVSLGIIPLSATQRLPRLLGLRGAALMILDGIKYSAADLRASPVFDLVTEAPEPGLLETALAFARAVAPRNSHRLVRERALPDADWDTTLRLIRENMHGTPSAARLGALDALRACAEARDFDSGMARARAIYDRLVAAPATVAARNDFLGGRR